MRLNDLWTITVDHVFLLADIQIPGKAKKNGPVAKFEMLSEGQLCFGLDEIVFGDLFR